MTGLATISSVHVGLGPIGRATLAIAYRHPRIEVRGGVDSDARLIGTDLGVLLGGNARGVSVRPRLSDVGTPGAADVVVLCTGSRISSVTSQILDALAWGASVVSTCEELAYPWIHHAAEAKRIDDAARSAGRTVLATGVNPGFMMDALACQLSALTDSLSRIVITRTVDATQRRGPLQKKVGVGISAADFESRRASGLIGHVGLVESAAMIAAGFGWSLDSTEHVLEPVIAPTDLVRGADPVRAGDVAGIHEVVRGLHRGSERIRLDLMISAEVADPLDEIRLHYPSGMIINTLRGINGDTATAAIVANAAQAMREMRPGLLTMLDVMPIRFRSA